MAIFKRNGDMDPLQLYLKDVEKYPRLSPEEELGLFELRDDPKQGKKAREKLVNCNLCLVVFLAQKFLTFGLPLMDVVQEGNVALMKAVDKFDPERGIKFSSYASRAIINAIQRAIASQVRTIRLPQYMCGRIADIKRAEEEHQKMFGTEPTVTELAEKLNMSDDTILEMYEYAKVPVSINYINEEEDEMEMAIKDNNVNVEKKVEEMQLKEMLTILLKNVPERDRKMIHMIFGMEGQRVHTLTEVAAEFGLSVERVRQIKRQVLTDFASKYYQILQDFLD